MRQIGLLPPAIVAFDKALGGQDNEGVGITEHGERYLIKTDPAVGLAEYVGASLCQAVGIPCGEPRVVTYKDRLVFGSRLEHGLLPAPTQPVDLKNLLSGAVNPTVFSAVLAIDIAVGNVDRHWHNWLFQRIAETDQILIRAIDFSRAWPAYAPPCEMLAMGIENTGKAWRIWPLLGVRYNLEAVEGVCTALVALDASWLAKILEQLPDEWMTDFHGPSLREWWVKDWQPRVEATRQFLHAGAWT